MFYYSWQFFFLLLASQLPNSCNAMNVMERERSLLNAMNVVATVSSDAENVAVMAMSCAMNATDVEEFDAHGVMVLVGTAHVFIVRVLDMILIIGNAYFAMEQAKMSVSPATAMDMMTVTNAMEMES